MNAGKLSDYLTVQVKTFTQNAEGQQVPNWGGDFHAWAEAQRNSEQYCRFIIRYNASIRPDTHRIIYFDAIWTITNAVPDRRHTTTTIDCDFSALVEVTSLTSTTREYIDKLPIVRPPSA